MDESKIDLDKLPAEVKNLMKNVENLQIDANKLPKDIASYIKSLDIKSLQKLKGSMDRENVIKEAVGILEGLKEAFSEQEQNALSSFINSVVKQIDKK